MFTKTFTNDESPEALKASKAQATSFVENAHIERRP